MSGAATGVRWEIGSTFDWREDFIAESQRHDWLPIRHSLFSTGCGALISLGSFLTTGNRRTLHLPSYYCSEVVLTLQSHFDLRRYHDIPTESSPKFETLCPSPGDVVLAVNFFGARDGLVWKQWLEQHPDATLVEDHTHDPFSPWALGSSAHYAMSSLRKTLPIPDGAVLWSPTGLPVPIPDGELALGAQVKLRAMQLKRAYLLGASIEKDRYRSLEWEGEQAMRDEMAISASRFTQSVLPSLDIVALRRKWEVNVRLLLEIMADQWPSGSTPLFSSWPPGAMPFNVLLVHQSQEARDSMRAFMISHKVYPAVHWPLHPGEASPGHASAIDLARRILTIPADFRYSPLDIERIGNLILRFK